MEDEHNVESDELIASNSKGQTDEDGVEDDAKLENKDGCELRGIRLWHDTTSFPVAIDLRVGDVVTLMAEVVFATEMRVGVIPVRIWLGEVGLGFSNTSGVGRRRACVVTAIVCMVVAVTRAKVSITHGHELEKEHDEDDHEDNAFNPGVLGDNARETLIRQGLIGRSQQVNESRSNNDTRAKVLCYKKDPVGDQL